MLLSLAGLGLIGLALHPPDLTPYVTDLSRFLSEQTGLKIQLAALRLETGLSPAVVGGGLEIRTPDSDAPILTAERLMVRISPLLLLRGGLPMAITLEAARATVRRDRSGAWHLGARRLGSDSASISGGIGPWLPNALTLTRSTLIWEDESLSASGEPVRLHWNDIQGNGYLEHSGRARFTAEAALPAAGDARVMLNGEWDAQQRWSLKLQAERWKLAPFLPYLTRTQPLDGLSSPIDLSAEVTGQATETLAARWRLKLGAGQLAWPTLFRWPFPITRLQAEGQLAHDPKGWHLAVDSFELASAHGEAKGQWRLTGLGGPDSPFLELNATASGTPSDQAKFYYPSAIMYPPLVQWLDHGLKDGHVKQASVRIRGHLANMPAGPNDPAEDQFHIEGDVVGLSLHYHPPLLPLTNITTHVVFDRYSMTAQVAEATYGGTKKVKGEVRIADMVHHPVVEIVAESPQVDVNSIWQEIVTHPRLRWDEAVGMAGAEAQGQGAAKLKITLPLQALSTLTYSGQMELKQVRFHPLFLAHPLVEANGVLTLDQDRLEILVNSARLEAWPLSGKATARHYRTPGKATFASHLDTRLEPGQLAEWAAPLLGEEGWLRGAVPAWLEFSRQAGDSASRVGPICRPWPPVAAWAGINITMRRANSTERAI
ncbi:MAG: hypothetical protein HQM00_06445 [Magnetococcales bacterium]|nr:hypothetical protein [Magnetococcales bacterium]